MIHFRAGQTDGVSLEMEKITKVLTQLGHEVFLCVGDPGFLKTSNVYVLPDLDFRSPLIRTLRKELFEDKVPCVEEGIKHQIEELAHRVEEGVRSFIRANSIDILIVHNLFSLPLNPPASIGVWECIKNEHVPAIGWHHDFFWEKEGYTPSCPWVMDLLARFFPPRSPKLLHVVINSLTQKRLAREGIFATVIPNVFDFDQPIPSRNAQVAETLGISLSEVIFLQATRIVPRKGIEIAVELLYVLSSPKYKRALQKFVRSRGGLGPVFPVLLLPNLVDDVSYCEALRRRIEQRGIDARFLQEEVGQKVSFWEVYGCADFVTYPSLQEGWGNQFLEAVWAKKPIAVFEYPVFRADIAPIGFRYISLGHTYSRDAEGLAKVPQEILRRAAEEVATLLMSPLQYKTFVDHNYNLAKNRLSLNTLEVHLEQLLATAHA